MFVNYSRRVMVPCSRHLGVTLGAVLGNHSGIGWTGTTHGSVLRRAASTRAQFTTALGLNASAFSASRAGSRTAVAADPVQEHFVPGDLKSARNHVTESPDAAVKFVQEAATVALKMMVVPFTG